MPRSRPHYAVVRDGRAKVRGFDSRHAAVGWAATQYADADVTAYTDPAELPGVVLADGGDADGE